MPEPVDQSARDRALDPAGSFIIQAPAGSGKTGLLVRRFLVLLATVEAPEQILAITFTRKAAAEMRQRIVLALQGLDSDGKPETDAGARALADAAMARDAAMDWELVDNPRRLRVQTIDSFCQELVRRMPWSARFGGVPGALEDAEPHYLEAADATLQLVDHSSRPDLAAACHRLLRLVDANRGQAQSLLAELLAGRDRWMGVLGGHRRAQFEAWWRNTIADTLAECHRLLDEEQRRELARVATLAAQQVRDPDNNARDNTRALLAPWADSIGFPTPDADQVGRWRGLAHLLLTDKGGVRRTANKNIGFPPGDAENKQRLLDQLEIVARDDRLHQAWQRISILPEPVVSDTEWESIDALLTLLPVAAAQLRLGFNQANAADFTEISQRADLALGGSEDPSDLGLALDYQLRHILMDEFQDTSSGQIELLRKLLAGWEPGDGRSLFLVGDPMQSIYRFREAEVGIFMDVQDRGIDHVHPHQLTLASNFRSAPQLVDWFNETFCIVMPGERSVVRGAVEYTRASPFLPPDDDAGVSVHAAIRRAHDAEAAEVVDCIERTLADFPKDDIAVLGRSRGHLAEIVAALNQRGIPFQGLKLEHLAERQAVQDLLALTLVLGQPADDVAWFGLLRAPWGGASLNDLVSLVGEGGETAVFTALQDESRLASLPMESRRRLERTRDVLIRGLADRARLPLYRNVQACWLRLGGPVVATTDDLGNCRRFIALVKQLESDGTAIHAESLATAMADLYAEHPNAAPVKLMTIHGAKGLEFDTVILPGLHRTSRGEGKPLLRWKRLPDRLLIAPRPHSNDASPMYEYLSALEKEHQRNERTRLLYVACTRARRRLHLFGSANPDKKGEHPAPPPPTTLLSLLWPAVMERFDHAMGSWSEPATATENDPGPPPSRLLQLDPRWSLPDLPSPLPVAVEPRAETDDADPIEFDWAREAARLVGIAIHRELQCVDRIGWEQWRERTFSAEDRERWRRHLVESGMAAGEVGGALYQVETALHRVQQDPRAAWIFAREHDDIRTEWALTGIDQGTVRHVVLDRAFVDNEGIRWVIDFKSSRHEDRESLADFLAVEKERYRTIMARYAGILGKLESRAIRTALYYPVLGEFLRY